MSQTEILSMKSGRDLDLKVALEIMDYLWITHWLRFSAEMAVKWIGTQQELDEAGGVLTAVKPSDFQELKLRANFDEIVPNFSTDLSAAQQVVDKMAELGYKYVTKTHMEDNRTIYYAAFQKGNIDAPCVSAATAAEAIVKAALVAVTR